ncbi:MAG: CDP-alcohol phosphatidyltransferase family protein [Planctomycetota bacterium]
MRISRADPPVANRPATNGSAQRRPRLRDLRSVPVLPSMVTLGNLFFGFLAMAKATDALVAQGTDPVLGTPALALLETAALLVFLAMVFDGLDGAVARMTRQTTAFGAQLDSLCDMVTFGVAPAFIVKLLVDFHARPEVGLMPANAKLYWAAAAVYVLCAAMRLARYNVESGDRRPGFSGLPTPAAAAVLCALVAFFATRADNKAMLSSLLLGSATVDATYDVLIKALPAILVGLGLLMISRVPYPHVIASLVRARQGLSVIATFVVLAFVAAVEWQFAMVALSAAYVLSGVALGLWRLVTGQAFRPAPVGGAPADRADAEDVVAGAPRELESDPE